MTLGRWGGLLCGAVMVVVALWSAAAQAAERRDAGQFNPADESVGLFEGIEQGRIAVKLIPKDSTECKVLIENKTDRPLNIKLPAAFAGVPVLAQIGNQGVGGNNTVNQGFGGGMMGGNMMGGGGFFNVAPEKVGQLQCATVCLEHGKKEPRPAVPYEIRPIESFTDKPAVHELCALLGAGKIGQRAAQAAAWHLENGMSWQELAAKQIRFADGTSRPYFTPLELQAAVQVAAAAVKQAEQGQPTSSSLGQSSGR